MKEGTARVNLFIIVALVLKLQFVDIENKIFYTIVRTTVHTLKEKLNGSNTECGWVSGSPVNNKNTMYVQHRRHFFGPANLICVMNKNVTKCT